MRKQTILPQTIIDAAITLIAENGLENISTRKVADSIKIAESSIFNYFPNKQALLKRCLFYVDRQIDKALRGIAFHSFNVMSYANQLWQIYFTYFIEHPNEAKFYQQFRHSAFYTQETIEEQSHSFSFFAAFVKKNVSSFGINPSIFWMHIIETTLSFAVMTSLGRLPDDEMSRKQFFNLIAYGFINVFNKDDTFTLPTEEEMNEPEEQDK